MNTINTEALSCIGGALEINVGSENYSVLVDFHKLNNSDEEFYNATNIVKQYNENKKLVGDFPTKLLSNFITSARFKELIEALLLKFNTSETKFYYKTGAGNKVQTYIHKELFLSLMIWLDARYELEITSLISQVSKQHFKVKDHREEMKIPTKSLHDTLKPISEQLFKDFPKSSRGARLYQHIHNAVNEVVTGKGKGVDRDTLTDKQIEEIEELEADVVKVADSLTSIGFESEIQRWHLLALLNAKVGRIKAFSKDFR